MNVDKEKLKKIMKNFGKKKILVIGDIMLDKYIKGKVERINPEAPVQVLEVTEEYHTPGGAANAANNVVSLGGKAQIIGVVGNDGASKTLKDELKTRGIITDSVVTDPKCPTIQKIRAVSQGQHLLRIDYEEKDNLAPSTREKIKENIKELIKKVDAVIVSDYSKGIVTKELMEQIRMLTEGKKMTVVVDPKNEDYTIYLGATIFTPNHKEAIKMTGIEEGNEHDLDRIGEEMVTKLNCNVLITRGEKGMTLFGKSGKSTFIPTKAREVYDVSGAGDTVVAALALSLASDATPKQAATIANYAAGVVVGKVGTSCATVKEIERSIDKDNGI